MRLNHVYTPLTTLTRLDPEQPLGRRKGRKKRDREQPERPQLLVELLNRRSFYLSGDTGSGKSTFCRWVTWLTCNGVMPAADVPAPDEFHETFPDQLRARLPVLVRLRDFWPYLPGAGGRTPGYAGLEKAMREWLSEQQAPGIDWPCLKGHLKNGSALMILDGVDEVPPVRREGGREWYPRAMLLEGLADAAGRWTVTDNRLLVTTRPYGLNSEQQQRLSLLHAPIGGLAPPLQALLVRRWFVRLNESRDQGLETAASMIGHLHRERNLDELAANPLLLTAMCVIYDEGKRLPQDKYELYDRIVDTVLHKRYPVKERVSIIRGRLEAVALGMHTGDGLGQRRAAPEPSASDREIDLLLQGYQQLDGSTDKGLVDTVQAREDLLSQSGLLVSRGDGRASFYHLSLQEFLAAERLFVLRARQSDGFRDLLLERGPAAGWRNTLSFVFGSVVTKFNAHVGVELLQGLMERTELPAVDPARRGQGGGVWNLAIVLGDCLEILNGREAEVPADLRDFFERAARLAIEQEISVKERHTLAVAWGRLGDPRIICDMRNLAAYVEIDAGKYRIGDDQLRKEFSWVLKEASFEVEAPFWLSRFPVTNSQFDLFVREGGYRAKAAKTWWSEEGLRWLEKERVTEPLYWRDPAWNAPNQPVVDVSFWEADAFARWAGGRLPSEREWEAAARGPAGFVYPWGNDWEDGICNSREAGLGSTSAVGIFPRSRSQVSELEDVAGNVWEWCADEWATLRVLRGGGWADGAWRCRSADRGWLVPANRVGYLGFRVAPVRPGKAGRGGREKGSGKVAA